MTAVNGNAADRKRSALEQRRQAFILESLGQSVYCSDDNGLLLYTNKAFDALFGYGRGELNGQPLSALYDVGPPPDAMDTLLTEIAAALRLQGQWSGEIRARRKDGAAFDIFATTERLTTPEGAIWVSVCEDITERKRRAREIQERRKEQEALLQEQVAAQTASAIAHELNQPLLAIASYNEAALRMLRSEPPALGPAIKALESSVRQTQRAGDVTRELLEIMNRRAVPYEPIDLGREARDSLATVRPDYELPIEFRLSVEPGVSAVYARRIHVQKVFINLMRNAIEAMTEAAVAKPELNVDIRPESKGNHIRVTVRDNGPGVDPGDLERIFNPFYTTKSFGMGMGLTICRALIEANGGAFWAEAGRQGAAFHFHLPIAE
jgi:PAS domain S-box-containing protein